MVALLERAKVIALLAHLETTVDVSWMYLFVRLCVLLDIHDISQYMGLHSLLSQYTHGWGLYLTPTVGYNPHRWWLYSSYIPYIQVQQKSSPPPYSSPFSMGFTIVQKMVQAVE